MKTTLVPDSPSLSELRVPLSPDAPVLVAPAGLRPALGFYALAVLGAAVCAIWLWGHPAALLAPAEAGTLARLGEGFALLVALPGLCGWIYQLTPLLSGSPWRWAALPWIHFGLHLAGLAWIVAASVGVVDLAPMPGGLAVLAGMLLLGGHHLATVSGRSWWEPANILAGTALGWLAAAVALAVVPGADRLFLDGGGDVRAALAVAATAGAALPLLLAGVMRGATLLSRTGRCGGVVGWVGWIVLNLGVLVAGAGAGSTVFAARAPGAWLVVAGTVCLAFAVLRAGWGGWRKAGVALGLATFGAFLLPVVLAVIARSLPERSAEAGIWAAWWRDSAVLLLAAPGLALALGGLTLFGRLFRPLTHDTSIDRAFAGPLVLVWALGGGYALAALRAGETTGLVLAAVCWLVALILLIFAAGSRAGLIPVKARSVAMR